MTIKEIENELENIEKFPDSCMDDLRKLAILQTKILIKISFDLELNNSDGQFKIKY